MADEKAFMGGLENTLSGYFIDKAPFQFPDNVKEILVKLAPWLAIIMLVFSVPALLVFLGVGAFVTTTMAYYSMGFAPLYYLSLVFLALQLIVLIISIPGLFGRKRSAWKLLFYSELLSLCYGVFDWARHPMAIFSLIGTLISITIGMYIIFQLREKYIN